MKIHEYQAKEILAKYRRGRTPRRSGAEREDADGAAKRLFDAGAPGS